MRILITGAAGFIGVELVTHLCTGHEIFALVRKLPSKKVTAEVSWIEQNLTQSLDSTGLPDGVDVIIHLAQSRFYRQFPEMVEDIFQVNVGSTLSLLEYGRKVGVKKFIYASSGGVYGYGYEKFGEADATNPRDFYLTSKYCSELLIGNYKPYFDTVVFRFFFVYGPKQKEMLIPRLINNIKKGEPIILFGKSGVRINPIHVMDAIKVFRPALETPVSGIFNVAGEESISIKELSEMLAGFLRKTPVFVYEKSNVSGDIIGDNSRMKSVLGVVPQISLRKGISELITLFRTVQGRE